MPKQGQACSLTHKYQRGFCARRNSRTKAVSSKLQALGFFCFAVFSLTASTEIHQKYQRKCKKHYLYEHKSLNLRNFSLKNGKIQLRCSYMTFQLMALLPTDQSSEAGRARLSPALPVPPTQAMHTHLMFCLGKQKNPKGLLKGGY